MKKLIFTELAPLGHMTKDTGHRTQDTGHRTQDTGRRTHDFPPFFSIYLFIFVVLVLLHAFVQRLTVSLTWDFNWVIPFPLHLFIISSLLYYCIIVIPKSSSCSRKYFVLSYQYMLQTEVLVVQKYKTKLSLPRSFFSGPVFIPPESWIPCSCPHLTTTQPNSTELKYTVRNGKELAHFNALHYITLQCYVLHYCTTLRYTVLPMTLLPYTVLRCPAPMTLRLFRI